MSPKQGSRYSTQSQVSCFIIILLIVIAATLVVNQLKADSSRFGISSAGMPYEGTDKTEVSKPPLQALSTLNVEGFKNPTEVKTYEPNNLYEKIDGKAPLYMEAGFRSLYTNRILSVDASSQWIELFLYDMAEFENAFSVYSTQKRPNAARVSSAQQKYHYKTSNGFYFVHDRYYGELVGSTEADLLNRAMAEIGSQICNALPPQRPVYPLEQKMALFPEENLVPHTFKFYLDTAFGFEQLHHSLTAQYKLDSTELTAFISGRANESEAQKTAKSYVNSLIESGASSTDANNTELAGCVFDFYGTTEIVFAAGNYAAGVHQAEDAKLAQQLAATIRKKLIKVSTNDR